MKSPFLQKCNFLLPTKTPSEVLMQKNFDLSRIEIKKILLQLNQLSSKCLNDCALVRRVKFCWNG